MMPDYADAIGQLRRREGRMAELGSEDGVPKLDWVEGVARLLADPDGLETVEREAGELRARGIRHVIWAGMGGSVMAVRVLVDLGFGGGDDPNGVKIYPLDSTDPAALNSIVAVLYAARGITSPAPGEDVDRDWLRDLLDDVLMVAVAMGMTSEEPITHLEWFTGLLATARLDPAAHCLVMALPESFLDRFAQEHHIPRQPLQLDGGTGTGGRMSAPTTRVFLLPAALWLTGESRAPGRLRAVLNHAWRWHDLDLAEAQPDHHPFVQLAAAMVDAADRGALTLMLDLRANPQAVGSDLSALLPWIEQLTEESLGKRGKGVMVFSDQPLAVDARCRRDAGTLRVAPIRRQPSSVTPEHATEARFALDIPGYENGATTWERMSGEERLAAVAANFLGWQLAMALFGYQHGITFAGQPAVEDYKSRARTLRRHDDPVKVAEATGQVYQEPGLTMIGPAADGAAAGSIAGRLIHSLTRTSCPLYLDVTINGDIAPDWWDRLHVQVLQLANQRLGIPGRVRRAPAAYHSTEQSEMDGPRPVVSLRLLRRERAAVMLGAYDGRFLEAQAVGTWQSMVEQGHECFLLLVDGDAAAAESAVRRLLTEVYEGV